MKEVILVSMPHRRDKDPWATPGHASIAAVLKANGIPLKELFVERVPIQENVDLVASKLAGDRDAYLTFGAYVWNEEYLRELVILLRGQGVRSPIVMGGPSISYTRAGQLEGLFPGVDYFIRGYGEEALVALMRGHTNANGIHVAECQDRCTIAIPEMESLASPWTTPALLVGPGGSAWWETKRGCPFRCSFCQHCEPGPLMKRREFQLKRLRREARQMVVAGVRHLKVIDPVFNEPGTHYTDVPGILREEGYAGTIALEARFEYVKEEFVELCAAMHIRPEFGLQTIVPSEEKAINRRNNLPKVVEAAALLREYNVPFMTSVMYGLPLQTPASFKTTLEFAQQLGAEVQAYRLGIYRGTKLYEEAGKWGLRSAQSGLPMIVSTSASSASDLTVMEEMAFELCPGVKSPEKISH